MIRWYKPLVATAALVMLAAVLFTAPRALGDTVVLKDGTKLEGVIDRETDEYLFIKVKFGDLTQPRLVQKKDIKEIKRDQPKSEAGGAGGSAGAGEKDSSSATSGVAPKADAPKEDGAATPRIRPGATKVAVVTLEEMVGPFMNANALKHSIELIPKEEKPDIVVLKINSGGGALTEVEPLSDTIQLTLKKDYRVVAWIESAISAAAMTAMNVEEIYMMKRGNLGGAVAFHMTGPGKAEAAKDASLEEILRLGELLASRGRYSPLVIRAMQEFFSLSADIDDNGVVTWRNDEKGQYLVNPKTRILTFNADDAYKFKISKGTADTLPELMRLLNVTEWVEVGKQADAYQVEFRANVQAAQNKINEIRQKLNILIAAAEGAQDEQTRGAKFGEAKRLVDEMKSWVRRAPSLEFYEGLTPERFKQIYDQLERIRKGKKTGGGR